MANSPTVDAVLARLAAIDHGCTRALGRVCGGPGETHPSSWCRACCARALMAHVATLLDDAAYHADCRPNRLAAEAAQARVLELEAQVAALTATERATADAFIAYRDHPHCTSATGWCHVCASNALATLVALHAKWCVTRIRARASEPLTAARTLLITEAREAEAALLAWTEETP